MGQFNWTPPATDEPVKKQTGWKPPENDVPVNKKEDTYQPTQSDIASKKSWDSLEYSFDKPQSKSDAPSGVMDGFRPITGAKTLPTTSGTGKTTAKEAMTSTQQKESDKVTLYDMHQKVTAHNNATAFYNQLHPDQQSALDKINNTALRVNQMDSMIATTPEEAEQQKAMDTTLGKVKKGLTYTASEGLKGGVDIFKGGAWVLNHVNATLSDSQLIPDDAWKGVDKFTDLGITAGQKDEIENSKSLGMGVTRTFGMLANIAPAAIGGEAAEIPKTMFALQGFGQGVDIINQVDPDRKLNPVVRDLFIAGNGAVNGLIMGDLKENVLSKSVQDKVVSAIVTDALKETTEKGLTEDTYKTALKETSKDFTEKFHDLFSKYAENTGQAAKDFSALNASQYILKKGVDASNDQPAFNANLGDLMGQISDVVTKQAPLFGGIGTMLKGGKEAENEKEKSDIGSQISQKDADIAKFSEKTADPVKNAENEVNLERTEKERDELNNQLKSIIKKQQDEKSKNEGQSGQSAETKKEDESGVNSGKESGGVQEGRQDDEVLLNQTGEAAAEPVSKESTNAIDKVENQESGVEEHQDGNESGETSKAGRGDSPEREKEEKPKPTSIKKVITEATRQEKQLPHVELTQKGTDKEVLERGKKLVGTGDVKPDEVIDRVISGKGIYTPDEAAAMQYHTYQLSQAEKGLRDQLSDINNKIKNMPNDETHLKAKDLILGNLRQMDDRIEEATRANRINSRSWSNLGNIMQIEADPSFQPANVRSIIKDNYGGEIPKDVNERIDKAESERDKALSDLKEAQEKFTKKQGDKVVGKIRESVKLVKQSKAELEEEADSLRNELRSAWKKDFGKLNSGIPIPTETLAVMGKLSVNYFKQGVKDFEGLANKLFDDLKYFGVSKDQIKEHLSQYEPLREESKKRDIELLGRKERSANKQVETGKIIDRSNKPKIVYPKNNDIVKAEQRVKDAEFKLKQEKQKSYSQTKSKTQRGLDYVIRWERRFVLSSPAILEKLGSAVTIGGGLKRLPEEVIGGLWTKLAPALMNKAPIEGGFNAKAEAKYWKEFSDPKKFLHNAKEILKTGASDLTKEFSDKPHEHYKYFDALTDLHPIIKDVSKRATYESSLIKGLTWAENNGFDISDPLIRQNIKQMAYNRAEYEIFQENSGWNRRLQKFLNDDRTPKNNKEMLTRFVTRFLMPVSTVPLNIARRIGNYTTGLPRGLYNMREAYKDGIENLSNEQTEIIAKQLKQGTMGAALFSMGLFGIGGSYGGFYNKDDKGGLKRDGVFTPGFDQMYFGKQSIRKPIQHALPLQLIQLGATYRDVLDLYINKYTYGDEYKSKLETELEANAQAMAASTAAIAREIPMISEPVEAYEALGDPYIRKKFVKDMKRRVTPTIAIDAAKLVK